jgi:hypothetical protein
MQLTAAQARAVGIKLPSKPRRPKKPPAPDSYTPHDCVILAIDPAKDSGWAILPPPSSSIDPMSRHGEGSHLVAVTLAKEVAVRTRRPLVVAAETWTTGDREQDRRMKAAVLLGLGAAWERWLAAFDKIGLPKSRIVRVNVATWRSKIIGGPMNRTSEEWKEAARQVATGRFPVLDRASHALFEPKLDDNEADALCIALWARQAGPVGEAVKKAGKRYP